MTVHAHTYSIVARDDETGQFGIGTQSHSFAVGGVVPWAEQGIGAVATQADTDESFGPLGIELLRAGKSANQALNMLLAADDERDVRQVAIVDHDRNIAAHTGKRCIDTAAHEIGDGFCVLGNLLTGKAVLDAMSSAYLKSTRSFSDRLLEALEAGQDAGGDLRGLQSAALMVVPGPNDPVRRRMVTNLRVDDHDHPLIELRRLVTIQRGQEWAAQAAHAVATNDIASAQAIYEDLRGLIVGSREPQFWYAINLAKYGHVDLALPVFAQVFAVEPQWATFIERLVKAGYFPKDKALVAKVMALPRKK